MKGRTRFLSIRRLWIRLRNVPADFVWKHVTSRRLTPEEWVDRTYERGIQKIRRGLANKLTTAPAGSSMRAYVEKLQSLPDETLLDEIYSQAHANPERAECPPYRTLLELVTRAPSMDDPAWSHIARCHPCSMELRTIKRAHQPRPS